MTASLDKQYRAAIVGSERTRKPDGWTGDTGDRDGEDPRARSGRSAQ
jgi:hypothetical protein